MGVLYHAAGLHSPSVLWMRRMLEALEDDITVLATEEDPAPDYADRYRVVVLRDGIWSLWWRACYRLKLTPSLRTTSRAISTLTTAIESPGVDAVLMHYLTQGVRYDRVWSRTTTPVFIHCHGYDVTWKLRLHHAPHEFEHASDYVDRVRALPEHVHLIANSELTRQRLRQLGIPDHRLHLKYLGVPVPASPPASRQPRDEVMILYLGRLVDFKGPELVIEAFDLACERGLRGRLVIAGDGPMRRDCELARERSRHGEAIELLGAVDAATGAALRQEADIFTAHNRLGPITGQEEAFGVSFVEAMAEGLPVVTGHNGSLPELIDDGVHGFLIEPNDIDGHARALHRLAEDRDLRAQIGRRAWQRARDRFSIEREATTLRSILGLGSGELS